MTNSRSSSSTRALRSIGEPTAARFWPLAHRQETSSRHGAFKTQVLHHARTQLDFLDLLYFVAARHLVCGQQDTVADKIVTIILFMLYSLPSFFVAVILLNAFTVGDWALFPLSGFESTNANELTTIEYIGDIIWHVTLPIICMSYGGLAALSRYARTGLLDVIRADYIRTARAKGLPEGVVIVKHAARNGMLPILTLLATLLPAMVGGSVIIEFIFGIPGMGQYILTSITQYDYNAVMAVLLISSVLTLVGMLLVDLAYAFVEPRITFD